MLVQLNVFDLYLVTGAIAKMIAAVLLTSYKLHTACRDKRFHRHRARPRSVTESVPNRLLASTIT